MEPTTYDEHAADSEAYRQTLARIAEERRVIAAMMARPISVYVESVHEQLQREHCEHAALVDAETDRRLAEEEDEENDEPQGDSQ